MYAQQEVFMEPLLYSLLWYAIQSTQQEYGTSNIIAFTQFTWFPFCFCHPMEFVVIGGKVLMNRRRVCLNSREPYELQNVFTLFDKWLSSIWENSTGIPLFLVVTKKKSDQSWAFRCICPWFSLWVSKINNTVFWDVELLQAFSEMYLQVFSPFCVARDLESWIESKQHRRCSIYSVSPYASHYAIGITWDWYVDQWLNSETNCYFLWKIQKRNIQTLPLVRLSQCVWFFGKWK